MRVFGRHDTALIAMTCGPFIGYAATVFVPGWGWRPQLALAAAVGLAAAAVLTWLRRGYQPDVGLVWIDGAEQKRLIAAPPPPDRALLCVVLKPSWGSRYRLEVFLDDVRLGQLRPGTAFLLPIRPGLRRLQVFNSTRRTAVTAPFDAVAGTKCGFFVRSWVSRTTVIDIERNASGVDYRGISEARLLRPLVSEA